jgi:hypothetical protein
VDAVKSRVKRSRALLRQQLCADSGGSCSD